MIQKKTNICDCGAISYGFKQCNSCRQKKYKENADKRKNECAGKENMNDLDKYFNNHIEFMKKNNSRCAECNEVIYTPSRWNVCHLLPKGIFKSVRSLNENVIYLCRLHHATFDQSYDSAKKMKIWNEAVLKVQSFLHIVKEKHKSLENYK